MMKISKVTLLLSLTLTLSIMGCKSDGERVRPVSPVQPVQVKPTANPVPQPESSIDGGHSGGGGEFNATEFRTIANDILDTLIRRPLLQVENEKLFDAIDETEIFFTDQELISRDGQIVDALNYPTLNPPRIWINNQRWEKSKNDNGIRSKLILHEYLGIMTKGYINSKFNDKNYQISSRLDRGKVCDLSSAIRTVVEFSFKKSCYKISSDELKYLVEVDDIPKNIPVGHINSIDFKRFPNLDELDLVNVDFISSSKTSKHPFEFLTESIRFLTLHNGKIFNIQEDFFYGVKDAQSIQFRGTHFYGDVGFVYLPLETYQNQYSSQLEIVLRDGAVLKNFISSYTKNNSWLNVKVDLREGSKIAPNFLEGIERPLSHLELEIMAKNGTQISPQAFEGEYHLDEAKIFINDPTFVGNKGMTEVIKHVTNRASLVSSLEWQDYFNKLAKELKKDESIDLCSTSIIDGNKAFLSCYPVKN
jgi:hypothetical protein